MNPIRIKRGDDWTNSFSVTTETGVDFTGCTMECQLKTSARDPYPKDVTVTVASNNGSTITGTLSLTKEETIKLKACEYLTDFKFTLSGGDVVHSGTYDVLVSNTITE